MSRIIFPAGGLVLSACIALISLSAPAQLLRAKGGIDTALVLAIDASGSINEQRWRLQLRGYRAAFRSREVLEAIAGGRHGVIAVTVVQWSNNAAQRQTIDWTLISDPRSAFIFAERVGNMGRLFEGGTSISGLINYSAIILGAQRFNHARKVIDVSGDGVNNDGPDLRAARDRAIDRRIVINGLPIVSGESGIVEYYRKHVIGGQDSFVQPADGDIDFARAVKQKLTREIRVSALPP